MNGNTAVGWWLVSVKVEALLPGPSGDYDSITATSEHSSEQILPVRLADKYPVMCSDQHQQSPSSDAGSGERSAGDDDRENVGRLAADTNVESLSGSELAAQRSADNSRSSIATDYNDFELLE